MFTKYGTECFECKKKRVEKDRQRHYKNRIRCVCGLYISDANPKEKHEKTQSHQNFIKYGTRSPEGCDYILRNGKAEDIFRMN